MPRPATIKQDKSPELVKAERAGQDLLHRYCRERAGRQKELVDGTGLIPAVISRMANYKTPINFEAAMLLDVATAGALPVEALCPSRADLVSHFLSLRAA